MEVLIKIFLENVLEAIYFSLFIIKGKGIKSKRLLFTIAMIFQYLILKCFIKYNVWFQIIYTFMTYIILKMIYKEKAQITDIFLFAAASLLLIIISVLCAIILIKFNIEYEIMLIINRIILFLILFIVANKINFIYKKYYKRWNRQKENTSIRSLTLRNISVIVFNLMFFIINIGLAYIILTK